MICCDLPDTLKVLKGEEGEEVMRVRRSLLHQETSNKAMKDLADDLPDTLRVLKGEESEEGKGEKVMRVMKVRR